MTALHDSGPGQRRRSRGRLVAALALVPVLSLTLVAQAASNGNGNGGVGGKGGGKPCASLLGCGDDVQEALYLEQRIADNLHFGLALPIAYDTADRQLGDVRGVDGGWGDAGIWSGNYLAAESFRYAVARKHLTGPGAGQDHDFWQDQQAEAKSRIDSMLAQVDLRTNIATAWASAPAPSVDPSTLPPGVHAPGVVQGEPGMLMFSCGPTDAAPGFLMPVNNDVRGPWRWNGRSDLPDRLVMPKGDYLCEASTSRDAYAGTLFGLLTAFDLVAPDDTAVRSLIHRDVMAIADYLLRHGWNWLRPDGNLMDKNVIASNFFLTPLMVISPTYRLGITQAALHVARAAGSPAEIAQWTAVWEEEFASQATAGDAISDLANDPSPTADYYGWNLAHLMYYNLVRLAANPAEAAVIRNNFSIIDRQTHDDVNAFFETVTYTMTGERSRLDDAVQHLRDWRSWRAKIDAGIATNNSARCGVDLDCVPQDEYDVTVVTPAGEVTHTVAGTSSTMRAAQPLPVADRRPADFLWQRSPFTGLDGQQSAEHQEPGIDYLVPYWMLRYYTEVAVPAVNPLPVWPGPGYSGS